MTIDPGTVLLLVIPAAPLVAALIVCGGRLVPPAQFHWPVIAGCVLSGTAALGLLVVALTQAGPGTAAVPHVNVYTWNVAHAEELRIDVSLRAQPLSLMMIVAVSLASIATAIHAGAVGANAGGRLLCAGVAGCQFAAAMLLAAGNLVQMFVFWHILGIAIWLVVRDEAGTKPAMQSSGRMLLTFLAADALLLAAIVICGTQLGTLSWPELFSRLRDYLADDLPDADPAHRAALFGLTGFLVVAAAVVRCGQFPAFGWLTDAGRGLRHPPAGPATGDADQRSPAGSRAVLVQAIAMPVGVFLVLRLQPILAAAPEARWMLLVLGSLTCVLAGLVAVCERETAQVQLFTTASQLGVMLCGAVSGTAAGLLGAVVLWIVSLTARTALVLFCDRESASSGGPQPPVHAALRRAVGWLALVLLVSGLGGQHYVLGSMWATAAGDATRALLTVLTAAGVPLTALALVQVWLGAVPRELVAPGLSEQPRLSRSAAELAVSLLLVGVAAAVSTVSVITPAWMLRLCGATPAGAAAVASDGPVIIVTLLLAAVGAVTGWLFWIRRHPSTLSEVVNEKGSARSTLAFSRQSQPSAAGQSPVLHTLSAAEAPGETLSSLIRLARRRFYLDEVSFLLLIFPIRASAQLVRFFEWLIVDGLTAGLPRRVPRWAARWTRPLDSGAGQFAALAIVLAGTVLLMMLTWD